jgi:uncharacterized membrane protein
MRLSLTDGASVKRYLVTGLLVLVPLVITLWVLNLIISTLDQSLLLLPEALRPQRLIGYSIPGLGVLLTLFIVFATGVLAQNMIGGRLVVLWEALLAKIPFVKSIYSSVKQVSDTLLSPTGQAFRKALLVQFPREGSWTVAFQTGTPGGEVASHLDGEYVSVYVPTTPNPTGGYFVMMRKADVVELNMSVDDALKYIISMGVVVPGPRSGGRRRSATLAQDKIQAGAGQ